MRKLLTISAIAVAVSAAAITSARADDVTDWNQTMLRSIIIAGTSPTNATRVAALVQAAVFDALNGIDRRYTPIHVPPNAPAGASRRAAVVQAAYVMIGKHYGTGGLFTTTQQNILNARRDVALATIGLEESAAAIASGVAWGQQVADAIWAWRSTDGFNLNPPSFVGGTAIGQWRPTPNAPAAGTSTPGAGYPQFFNAPTWSGAAPSQFDPGPPPALNSARYLADFNEVKTMGSGTSAVRTTDQTIGALFWNSSTATYLWNHVTVSLMEDRNRGRREASHKHKRNTLLENARVLAAVDVAMADAVIGCWTAKYAYTFWRPITAIREDDNNPATVQDPTWSPLFATPAHPEYPSGHSCVSGAAASVLAHEFGAKIPISIDSDTMIGVTREFHGFADALEDVKDARIFAGIHFRSATEAGTMLGAGVADYVLEHLFQRVD